jgi:hypothetical protein
MNSVVIIEIYGLGFHSIGILGSYRFHFLIASASLRYF